MSNKYTPMSEIELQYRKEYTRAKQAIRRQQKIGYSIPNELLPISPGKLKTPTQKDLQKVSELTPKFIREHSYLIDEDSGEAVYGLDIVKSHHKAKPSQMSIKQTAKKQKKQKTVSPQFEDRIPPKEVNLNSQIIEDITNLIATFDPRPWWRDNMRARKYGIHATLSLLWGEVLEGFDDQYELAFRIEQKAEELRKVTNRLLYDSDSGYDDSPDMGRFGEIVFGKPFTQAESDYYSDYAYNASMQAMGYL